MASTIDWNTFRRIYNVPNDVNLGEFETFLTSSRSEEELFKHLYSYLLAVGSSNYKRKTTTSKGFWIFKYIETKYQAIIPMDNNNYHLTLSPNDAWDLIIQGLNIETSQSRYTKYANTLEYKTNLVDVTDLFDGIVLDGKPRPKVEGEYVTKKASKVNLKFYIINNNETENKFGPMYVPKKIEEFNKLGVNAATQRSTATNPNTHDGDSDKYKSINYNIYRIKTKAGKSTKDILIVPYSNQLDKYGGAFRTSFPLSNENATTSIFTGGSSIYNNPMWVYTLAVKMNLKIKKMTKSPKEYGLLTDKSYDTDNQYFVTDKSLFLSKFNQIVSEAITETNTYYQGINYSILMYTDTNQILDLTALKNSGNPVAEETTEKLLKDGKTVKIDDPNAKGFGKELDLDEYMKLHPDRVKITPIKDANGNEIGKKYDIYDENGGLLGTIDTPLHDNNDLGLPSSDEYGTSIGHTTSDIESGLMEDQLRDRRSKIYEGEDPGPFDYMELDDSLVNFGIDYMSYIFTPMQTFGVGGMPASFLTTTDPPRFDGKHGGLGTVYMENYIRYGQYIAFRPSVYRYKLGIKDAVGKIMEGSLTSIAGGFAKIVTGGLAQLYPRNFNYWLQVSRLARVAIHQMGLQDRIFRFQIGLIGNGYLKGDIKMRKDGSNNNYTQIFKYKFGDIYSDTWGLVGAGFANIVGNKGGVNFNFSSPEGKDYFDEDILDGGSTGEIDLKNITTDHLTTVFLCSEAIPAGYSIQNQPEDSPLTQALISKLDPQSGQALNEVLTTLGASAPGSEANIFNFLTGKWMVPKMWGGSDVGNGKEYSCKIVLSTSSGDRESRFLNIIYPLCKLMPLFLPESTGGMLFSPWMVNVFSAGSINIEHGMITGANITKNVKNMADDGMPTEMIVDLTITDMRSFLFMEKPRWWDYASKYSGSVSNVLATLIGNNFSTIDPKTKIEFQETIAKLNSGELALTAGQRLQIYFNQFVGRKMLDTTRKYLSIKDKVRFVGIYAKGLTGYNSDFTGNR